MNKTVTVHFDEDYMELTEDQVAFGSGYDTVVYPIEVFYQMWNSEEMINHMEDYHGSRSDKRRQEVVLEDTSDSR